MGTYTWNILYCKILSAQSRAQRHRPAATGPPSQAEHWNLATGPSTDGIYIKKKKILDKLIHLKNHATHVKLFS